MTLVLSPTQGWNEVSFSSTPPGELLRRGLLPLVIFVSLTVFMALFFGPVSPVVLFEKAVVQFGGLFVSFFIGRLLLETLLKSIVDGDVNETKCQTVAIYAIALVGIYEMIENCMPVNLGFLKFLPIFIALIVFKAARYLNVKSESEVAYLCLSALVLVVIPLVIIFGLDMLVGGDA